MEFPDAGSIAPLFGDVVFPRFARVRYDPPTPTLDDVVGTTRTELSKLPLSGVPDGGRVAVGVGSRGIDDIVPVARTVVDHLSERGFEPVVVPAMGSHGGATAEGQRETLAALGLTEDALGCPIDARMETTVLGRGDLGFDVHVATAAFECDGVVVVNRVKPHTNYTGEIESGLSKMLAIGLGKQPGARLAHEYALSDGYVAAIRDAVAVIRRAVRFLGGVAIVENAAEETAAIEVVPDAALEGREPAILARARELMSSLPYDDLDVLVVDRIGKDISGSGMDTNVVGRYRVLNAEDPETPDISRIYVRGLTDRTHGNGNGIGLADITRRSVVDDLDFTQLYTNTLTSNSLGKAHLPVVMPDDELALTAAVSTIGPYDPERVRIAWIRDTSHLGRLRLSPALVDAAGADITVEGWDRLTFEDGGATFVPVDEDGDDYEEDERRDRGPPE